MALRQRILSTFEQASMAGDDAPDRDRLLAFVLGGGGPTSVEIPGSIAELARDMLSHDFHRVGGMRVRVAIVGSPAPRSSCRSRRASRRGRRTICAA